MKAICMNYQQDLLVQFKSLALFFTLSDLLVMSYISKESALSKLCKSNISVIKQDLQIGEYTMFTC